MRNNATNEPMSLPPLRVGNYRVLYVVEDAEKKIEVISAADREEVYQ